MRLYIIRHGETPWNQSMRLQGHTDIALNDNGRSLAEVTARALRDVPFDLCYTSPLIRARETAQIVLGSRNIPVIDEPAIQEISFGCYEGRCVRNENREITVPLFYQFFHQPELYFPPEGGESIDELCRRTGKFLDELALKQELYGKTILVSTHGAASRALLSNIKKSERKDFWDGGVPKNCAVTIVELEKQNMETRPNWAIIEQDLVFYEDK